MLTQRQSIRLRCKWSLGLIIRALINAYARVRWVTLSIWWVFWLFSIPWSTLNSIDNRTRGMSIMQGNSDHCRWPPIDRKSAAGVIPSLKRDRQVKRLNKNLNSSIWSNKRFVLVILSSCFRGVGVDDGFRWLIIKRKAICTDTISSAQRHPYSLLRYATLIR